MDTETLSRICWVAVSMGRGKLPGIYGVVVGFPIPHGPARPGDGVVLQ